MDTGPSAKFSLTEAFFSCDSYSVLTIIEQSLIGGSLDEPSSELGGLVCSYASTYWEVRAGLRLRVQSSSKTESQGPSYLTWPTNLDETYES